MKEFKIYYVNGLTSRVQAKNAKTAARIAVLGEATVHGVTDKVKEVGFMSAYTVAVENTHGIRKYYKVTRTQKDGGLQ